MSLLTRFALAMEGRPLPQWAGPFVELRVRAALLDLQFTRLRTICASDEEYERRRETMLVRTIVSMLTLEEAVDIELAKAARGEPWQT